MDSSPLEVSIRLDQLIEAVPLAPQWSKPQIYPEDFQLGDLRLKTVGLVSKASDQNPISGSAASEDFGETLERAYFELLERTSIIEALQTSQGTFEVMNCKGVQGRLSREQVFPADAVTGEWKYSKSNGVAAHRDFQRAARSAALELIERDQILKSWYDGGPVLEMRLEKDSSLWAHHLEPYFTLKAYLIGKGSPVVGVFGFPKSTEWPLLMGFGASEDPWGALAHAKREAVQRLAFLWGEAIPSVCPDASPSPSYHLEYYLYPKHAEKITQWLESCQDLNFNFPSESDDDFSSKFENIWFLDITPSHLKSKIAVVKAISDQMTPLVFGPFHPFFPAVHDRVHPIA